jgi:hypothetical protein
VIINAKTEAVCTEIGTGSSGFVVVFHYVFGCTKKKKHARAKYKKKKAISEKMVLTIHMIAFKICHLFF